MAKSSNSRVIAHHYYVEKGYAVNAIAELLGVSRQSISAWIKKGNWNTEIEARELSARKRDSNREKVLSDLAADRIGLRTKIQEEERRKEPDLKLIRELRQAIAQTDDAISKWSKAKERADKEDRIRLDVYLEVMDSIFSAMRLHDFDLYQSTLDFQEKHVNEISNQF